MNPSNMPVLMSAAAITNRELRTLQGMMSGSATFAALQQSVTELSISAPQDHDVFIVAFNIRVTQVRYVEPHTFIFQGFNDENHHAFVTFHFSQLVAHVIYVPKSGPERIITGFAVGVRGN